MNTAQKNQLDWIDALKAFAIIGIIMVHFVEALGYFPIFTSPSYDWPPLSERIAGFFPSTGNPVLNIFVFLSWLGDYGPGIFILLSGFTLTLSALKKEKSAMEFYQQRLFRIYPLYVTIHIIVLLFAVFVFKWDIKLFSPTNLFSMAGLRFIDDWFFFLNPSWWFIWLILQLYLLFPALVKLLKIKGPVFFLSITFLITIVSRLAGLTGYTYSNFLEFWMMGLFGGTRLFEFAFGMILANWYYFREERFIAFIRKPAFVFSLSLFSFLLALTCSVFYWGSLISLILVSMGLSGIFYSLYCLPLFQKEIINKPLKWLGRNSFSAFLLHQPFMIFSSTVTKGNNLIFWLLIIIILSFVLGSIIEALVNKSLEGFLRRVKFLEYWLTNRISFIPLIIAIMATGILSFFMPLLSFPAFFNNLLRLFFLILILSIFLYRKNENFKDDGIRGRFLDLNLLILISFIILTSNWFQLFGSLMTIGLIFILITIKIRYLFALTLTTCLCVLSILLTEIYLSGKKPLELMQWGELPALQIDEKTGYGLIPNKTTHLKYNNYDYFLKTNSLSLASPEIIAEKEDHEFRILIIGDAFSMPEGVEYEFSYPFLLEQKLKNMCQNKKITVINGAVTGFGPNEFLAQLTKYIDTINPDLIVNQFYVNEFEEINYPIGSRNEVIGFFLKDSKRDYYFSNRQVPFHFRKWIQKVFGDHPKHKEWKSLHYLYQTDSPYYNDSVLVKIDHYFDQTKEICLRNNSKVIFVFVPAEIAVSSPDQIDYFPHHLDLFKQESFNLNYPNQIIENICLEKDLDLIDLTPFLRNHPIQPVYFTRSWHWNKEGHKLVSKVLAEKISTLIKNRE
jgi:peptidoglycan/LPS O-acetylase OafA/YrhL